MCVCAARLCKHRAFSPPNTHTHTHTKQNKTRKKNNPTKNNHNSGGTWGAILGALLFTALLLLVLDSATRWARIDASERVDGVEHAARKHKKSRVMDHLLETVMMAVGSGSAPTASSWVSVEGLVVV